MLKNFSKFGFFILYFAFFACKNELSETSNITRDQLNIEKGKEVEIIYSDSAHVKVRVTGPVMLYYTEVGNPRQEFTEGVKCYFYDPMQQQQSVLTGKYAIRDERKNQVIVRDSVVWESVTDGRLETSELVWDVATNVIRSTKFAKITRQNETIRGFNFETNDRLTRWKILNPIGTLKVGEFEKQLQ